MTGAGIPVSEPSGPGVTVVKVPVATERGAFTLVMSVSDEGWLGALQLAPASAAQPTEPWQPPPYADAETFAEEEVTVGSGPLAVPGTLSLPHTPAPGPAVVLRFDKVTYAHASEVAKDRGFTLADEYVPDAVAAVRLLRQHPAVDRDRVFVLGHSLGGTVAPRVAVAEPAIAGPGPVVAAILCSWIVRAFPFPILPVNALVLNSRQLITGLYF